MSSVKFLDLGGLTRYDEKIKKLIAVPGYINDYKVNINDDKTSGSTNLFQCGVPFTVYFKGEINDESTIKILAYDANMNENGSLTQSIKDIPMSDGYYKWLLNPTDNDYYFKFEWNALSCEMMYLGLRPSGIETISTNEINDLW